MKEPTKRVRTTAKCPICRRMIRCTKNDRLYQHTNVYRNVPKRIRCQGSGRKISPSDL